jgi:hypothetical protein
MPKSTKRPSFDRTPKLARQFPGVELGTSYGTPALKVKDKFLARLRTEAEGWLAIRCDFVDRNILLQAAPHVFHLTEHYENYPMILVDLDKIDPHALRDVIERAWRMTASAPSNSALEGTTDHKVLGRN